ncbi:methyltransferase domain-containing protein [Streptomyces albidoflavus]|nr:MULTISPECIES: methyltransferase domain-containing protein [Streptomyces]MCQ9707692.1 class I SAM-dependent methyltransferase [Streptomyces sp. BSP1]MCR0991060.1 class I SAM-dependent methyltransferase [Streptomyces albidoflavus]MDH6188970.1 SAM-dependent methyltransferase [Streptomyces sp. CZ24]QDD58927.1 class I SAM-dependent methyltransferase [Streptomyces albidoflavus]WTC02104.1 class I SAM-dependent methyltransferase [Streptomyces albidoflavus]
MHRSAYEQMQLCVATYLPTGRRVDVVDLGSRVSDGQKLTHRSLLEGYDVAYTGVDVRPGANVDRVMTAPYRLPVRSSSADVVLSGQAFEHIPFFWASMLEITRVLKPGGLAFVTAPSRGHVHDAQDCWRYYPDGFRALAAYCRLDLREAYTDFPPVEGIRHAYRAIDAKHAYWGDSVGVFQKPRNHPRLTMALVRATTLWWANRVGGVDSVPLPAPLPGRERCGRPTRSAPVPAPAPAAGPGPATTRQGTPGHAGA